MRFAHNPLLSGVEAPPIAEVQGWLDDREFPAATPLIDLLQAVPGYGPADSLIAFLRDKVADPVSAVYSEIEGIPLLRDRLAGHMTDLYGGSVGSENVCITAGCNQAFFVAVVLLARSGDEIILPTPYYFNHKMTLDMLGIGARLLPCREDAAFVPDPADARRMIGRRTRAIVLVTPNNPTGSVYPPATVEAFFDLAEKHDIPLILDETYRDFLPPQMNCPHGLFRDRDWPNALIHLYSFSKVYCVTGYRVGALVAAPALIAEATKVMDCLAICAPTIGQEAALFGIENLEDWRSAKRTLMHRRVDGFRAAMRNCSAGYSIASIGAYFAYMRHPFEARSAKDVAKHLAREHNLLCLPGSAFGMGQERYLRFAFANIEASSVSEIPHRLA
jgi:aspartate/methionine/tyrosine aminotransferase